jgi:hypothetical protein
MASDRAAGAFAKLISRGLEIRQKHEMVQRAKAHSLRKSAETAVRFSDWTNAQLIEQWNTVGCDDCSKVCCEDVHWELNRRGLGGECAV